MSTRKSLAFSFLDRYAALLMAIVSSMVLARLLTPAEVGIYSSAMSLLIFMSTVRDLGAGQYLLQAKQLDRESIRAVWAIQLGVGTLLAALVFLLRGAAADYFHEPRIKDIMAVVALNFLVNPFGSITYAWLMREMRFGALASMRFLSALSTALVSTLLAWKGHGPISLAWGSLAGTVMNALVAMLHRPPNYPWMPGLARVHEVFSFGSRLTATSLLNTLVNIAPDFLLGKLQGMTAAGLFSRSNGLVSMFRSLVSDAVNAVALPHFARTSREGGDTAAAYLQVLSYISAVGWFFCVNIALLAHPLIHVLYGDQWGDAVDLTRVLALAMAFQVPVGTCQVLLTGTGQAPRLLRTTLMTCTLMLLALVAGAWQGLTLFALSLSAAAGVNMILWLRTTAMANGVSGPSLMRVLSHSALLAGIAGLPAALWGLTLGLNSPWSLLNLLVCLPLSGLLFLALCVGSKHPMAEEVYRLLQALRARLQRIQQGHHARRHP